LRIVHLEEVCSSRGIGEPEGFRDRLHRAVRFVEDGGETVGRISQRPARHTKGLKQRLEPVNLRLCQRAERAMHRSEELGSVR
jgi:hypothetical protein